MSYVIVAPAMMSAAATDLTGIGSSLNGANAAAAASTTNVIPAAADEVSAAIASLLSSHGKAFQALSAQAARFHSQFVQALNAGARAYAATEAANAEPLNVAVSVFGHPLVQLGSAHATSGPGLAVAVGANSDATTGGGIHCSAFAIGAGSDATARTPGGTFDTAIAVGTNDTAVAGGSHVVSPSGPPGGPTPALSELLPNSHDTAVALGTGRTADATAGNHDRVIVTPFGAL
jgi:hypothetical protein